jgi:hypothetical protein
MSASRRRRAASWSRTVPPALAAPQREPTFVAPAAPAGEQRLNRYLDRRTKAQARLAPLAIAVLVLFAVLIYLATK